MPALVVSGTQTAVISTEHTLSTQTLNATYILVVDTSNMVNGDVLELKIKTKVLSSSTSRIAIEAKFSNIQSDPNKYSIPIPSNNEIVATLKQTAGTGRNFDWALLTI